MDGFNPVVRTANKISSITGKLVYIGITIGVVIALIAIFAIASCSIGMQCMNSNSGYKDNHKKSYNFMIFSLIMSLILLMLGIAIIVWSYI